MFAAFPTLSCLVVKMSKNKQATVVMSVASPPSFRFGNDAFEGLTSGSLLHGGSGGIHSNRNRAGRGDRGSSGG